MEDIYKQALLDAKAVRASAMANAKASLQEAFEPKIQEMIRLKLSEELEEELDEEKEMEEAKEMEEGYQEEGDNMEEGEMDEASLEEILAELDELAKQEEGDKMEEADDEAEDESDDESDEESDDESAAEEVDDDTKIIDITLGDLKAVLQSIQGGEDMSMDSEEAPEETSSEEGSEEDVTLGEVDLDEILNGLQEEKDKEKEDAKKEGKKMEEKKKMEEVRSNLNKANKTIQVLRAELNEVNLLNAKLLYMNKIFKAKNLSESQKVSVVSALDRASNVKEAKNIYETLKENIQPKKSQLVESKGFASKPAGVAPKKPIIDSDPYVSRWQKIAGITK